MRAFLLTVVFCNFARAASPVVSVGALTTGNGYGFSVFDLNQKKITQFL